MSNIDDLAKQIGDAVMDAIEQNRRINKGDLIDAAHNVLRRRQALLAVDAAAPGMAAMMDSVLEAVKDHQDLFVQRPARPDYREADRSPTWINHRPPGMEPKPSKLPRLIVRGPDGDMRRVTEEEAAVLLGVCCQRNTP